MLYDKEAGQVTWPACIKELSPPDSIPPKNPTGEEAPKSIWSRFNKQGIFNQFPIRSAAYLGECNTAKYLDCPNTPRHHIENAKCFDNAISEYWENIGRYQWFDFDIVSSDEALIKLRTVVNIGDGDCNNGCWGAAWTRNRGELIANILSTGDTETTIEVISEKHLDLYKPYGSGDGFSYNSSPYRGFYSDTELGHLIGLGIDICTCYKQQPSVFSTS